MLNVWVDHCDLVTLKHTLPIIEAVLRTIKVACCSLTANKSPKTSVKCRAYDKHVSGCGKDCIQLWTLDDAGCALGVVFMINN